MVFKKLKRKRHIIYQDDLTKDVPGIYLFQGDEYEVFRLVIRRRDTGDDFGESNYLIRSKSNNLRYLILYGFKNEACQFDKFSFWINNKVLIPPGDNAYAGDLLDEEVAELYIMDFIENYLKFHESFPKN